jgi:hypothetical protein
LVWLKDWQFGLGCVRDLICLFDIHEHFTVKESRDNKSGNSWKYHLNNVIKHQGNNHLEKILQWKLKTVGGQTGECPHLQIA